MITILTTMLEPALEIFIAPGNFVAQLIAKLWMMLPLEDKPPTGLRDGGVAAKAFALGFWCMFALTTWRLYKYLAAICVAVSAVYRSSRRSIQASIRRYQIMLVPFQLLESTFIVWHGKIEGGAISCSLGLNPDAASVFFDNSSGQCQAASDS